MPGGDRMSVEGIRYLRKYDAPEFTWRELVMAISLADQEDCGIYVTDEVDDHVLVVVVVNGVKYVLQSVYVKEGDEG